MDALTYAADAILQDKCDLVQSTSKKNRQPFQDLTNSSFDFSHDKNIAPSLKNLFSEKINSSHKAKLRTPSKRRKNAVKYGDENQAPSPKTPKNQLTFLKTSSPQTPFSNLKLLTRVASMEDPLPSYEILGKKCASDAVLRRCNSENIITKNSALKKVQLKRFSTTLDSKPNTGNFSAVLDIPRKEKSLSSLCERFFEFFPLEVSCLETPRRLVIDEVASSLGIERRRVYDIVNILECLNIASRVQKNMYQWLGNQHLELTLKKLKKLGLDCGANKFGLETFKFESKNSESETDVSELRMEKSIGILCQKFLMLFLASPLPHIIQLDSAIQALLGHKSLSQDNLRAKGRRIYDIANVLVALKLIKKLPHCKAFMYIGPEVQPLNDQEAEGIKLSLKPKLRHSLLLPPFINYVHPKGNVSTIAEQHATPAAESDTTKISLETEGSCRAKRNCLVGRTKSEENKLKLRENVSKLPLLHSVYEVAEIKREKLLQDRSKSEPKPRKFEDLKKQFKFPHIPSKVALTFQNKCAVFKYLDREPQHSSQAAKSEQPKKALEDSDLNCDASSSLLDSKPAVKSVTEFCGFKNYIIKRYQSDEQSFKTFNKKTQSLDESINTVRKITTPKFLAKNINLIVRPANAIESDKTNTNEGTQLVHQNKLAVQKVGKILYQRPLVFRKVETTNGLSSESTTPSTKPIYVIQTSNKNSEISRVNLNDRANKSFKIYSQKSQQFRTLSLTDLKSASEVSSAQNRSQSETPKGPILKKFASQMTAPNVNLNTLSKSHYKTILDNSTNFTKQEPSKDHTLRFIINSKQNKVQSNAQEKDNKSATFVKMFKTSPDSSSTDELESIFGDTFKFSRPGALMNTVGKLS